MLGLHPTVRNGFAGIRLTFQVKGAPPAEQLAALIHQSPSRSTVYDLVTNGVPGTIEAAE